MPPHGDRSLLVITISAENLSSPVHQQQLSTTRMLRLSLCPKVHRRSRKGYDPSEPSLRTTKTPCVLIALGHGSMSKVFEICKCTAHWNVSSDQPGKPARVTQAPGSRVRDPGAPPLHTHGQPAPDSRVFRFQPKRRFDAILKSLCFRARRFFAEARSSTPGTNKLFRCVDRLGGPRPQKSDGLRTRGQKPQTTTEPQT